MKISKNTSVNQNFGYITIAASRRIRKGYEEEPLPSEIKDLRRYFSEDKDYILDFKPEEKRFYIYSTDYYRTGALHDYYVHPNTNKRSRDIPTVTLLEKLINLMDRMKVADAKGIGAVKRIKKMTFKDFHDGMR